MSFNAIAYAQVRLRGGAKNILWSSVAYLAALGIGMAVVYGSTRPKYRPEAFDALMSGLIALQALVFFFFGMFSIAGAVKGDLNGGMIESHRLMPVSSGSAVFGYLLGAPAQAYALYVINFFLGVIMYVLVPRIWISENQWFLYNGMLIVLGIFFFSLGIYWNMLGRNVGRYLIGFVVLYWISRGELLGYLPGLMLLFSPSLWTFRTTPPEWVFTAAGAAELVIGAILLVAAAHKYRWPDRPAFTRELSLLLMAAMAGVFVVAINIWPTVITYSWYDDVHPATQFVCSLSLIAWLGMIAAVSSVRYSPNLPGGLLGALAASLIGCIMFWVAPSHSWWMLMETAMIIFIFEFTLLFLLRFFYARIRRGALWTFLVLVVMWALPFIADAVRYSASTAMNVPQWTSLAALSPFGAMFMIWKQKNYLIGPGIAFQVILLMLAIVLYAFFSGDRAKGLADETGAWPGPLPPPLPQTGQLEGGNL